MDRPNKVPDSQLTRSVNMKIAQRSGGSGCKVTAVVSNGYVTLSGTVDAEYQKRPIINAINGINGVRRIVDSMTVAVKKKKDNFGGT
jgi:osmotically-inducible protein OsmY